ncbi:type II toxin-antitoxin system RelB/DinJ family antitoxin [Bifidobacterium aquikefiricola]|uniref:Type II toxin-antitoxin system RelB/DinJ family antitoxin n=1 Tax=Bifidobacterium aquikefiricola TaxID=3059038 RepID=A0AB39U891_9BIFI
MAATARIQVRTDAQLKAKADRLFHDLGLDTGTAINMFLAQAVADEGLPFRPSRLTPFDRSVLETESEPVLHGGTAEDMKAIIARV